MFVKYACTRCRCTVYSFTDLVYIDKRLVIIFFCVSLDFLFVDPLRVLLPALLSVDSNVLVPMTVNTGAYSGFLGGGPTGLNYNFFFDFG